MILNSLLVITKLDITMPKVNPKYLHPYCQKCIKSRVVQDPVIDEGKVIHKKGEFIIDCKGIPGEGYLYFDGKFMHEDDLRAIGFDEDQIDIAKQISSTSYWAYKNIIRKDGSPWQSRVAAKGPDKGLEYQKIILDCTANRVVTRCGRRIGKSEAIVIKALYFAFTNSPRARRKDSDNEWAEGLSEVMMLAPFRSQVSDLFMRIREYINASPSLRNSIVRNVKNPTEEVVLANGSRIKGFSAGTNSGSGAASSRGQDAHFLVLDETAYLQEEDLIAIQPVLGTVKDASLLASSTPVGPGDVFYNLCNDPGYKEFFFPSFVSPAWTEKLDIEMRRKLSEMAYAREVLAEFGDTSAGVFQNRYVDMAQFPYEYQDKPRDPNLLYVIGGDWNDEENGSTFTVMEYSPITGMATKVDSAKVSKAGWNQSAAVHKVVDLNKKWLPAAIYLDKGYGAYQIEVLKSLGLSEAANPKGDRITSRLANIVHSYDFSSTVEVIDPITSEKVKKRSKPFLVENAVRFFEHQQIRYSEYDSELTQQLRNYIIKNVTVTGVTVYGRRDENIGDHTLDSLLLALVAITLEWNAFTTFNHSETIQYLRENVLMKEKGIKSDDQTPPSQRKKIKDRNILESSNTSQTKKIINHPDDFTLAPDEKDSKGYHLNKSPILRNTSRFNKQPLRSNI
jgi:hypothetical protein